MNGNGRNINYLILLAGLAMTAAGLYWFMSSVNVVTGFNGLRIGSMRLSSGLVAAPFIAGVAMMFYNHKAMASRLVLFCGVILIIASVIMSTRFVFRSTTLFEYLVMLTMIFGGGVCIYKAVKN